MIFSSVWQAGCWNGQSDARAGEYFERPGCKCCRLSALWCTAGKKKMFRVLCSGVKKQAFLDPSRKLTFHHRHFRRLIQWIYRFPMCPSMKSQNVLLSWKSRSVFDFYLCWTGVGKQVGQWAEAGYRHSEARVSGVGHQTSPGPAEIHQQQPD